MKFCSKCGNELFDEAVVCPKCGCPIETNAEKKNIQHSKINTGMILNNIAFIFNLLISGYFIHGIYFYTEQVTETESADINITIEAGSGSGNGGTPNLLFFWIWIAFILITFALGIVIKKRSEKVSIKAIAYLYLLCAIVSIVLMNVALPNLMMLLMCFIGVLFYIPTILQVIASVKFLQGSK